MIKDVDYIIDLMKSYTFVKEKKKSNGELGEQDAAAGGGGAKPMPKWADLYALKRGKANMLGKAGEKWTTGIARGLGNQVW